MQQVYEDLLYPYNKVVRPVKKPHDKTVITFNSYLIQLIDVVSKTLAYLFRVREIMS